jgi:cobalamin biosynthesis Mg chelatase CobN
MIAMRRLGTVLALVAAALIAWGSPAFADQPGFSLSFSAPGTFTIGKAAKQLTAEVATDRGRRCQKVRWNLTIRAEGVSLDQISVKRVENDQEFAVRAQLREDSVRLSDTQLDPGQLCRDQTVSARWDIALTGPDDGTVTFEARALDLVGRVLSSAQTTSRVVSPVAATRSPSPSASPSASPTPSPSSTFTPEPDPADEAAEEPADAEQTQAAALNPASGTPSVLGPGLIVGAVLVFLGVGLLLRLRTRNRRAAAEEAVLPTGFYTMPPRR